MNANLKIALAVAGAIVLFVLLIFLLLMPANVS